MRGRPLEFVTDLATSYGDITSHLLHGQRLVMVHHPDLVRRVLRDNGHGYTKQGTPDDMMLRPLLGNGLLTSSGRDWELQRKMYAPAFRPARITAYDEVVTDCTQALVKHLAEAAESGEPLPMDHHLTGLTLGILIRVISGTDVGEIGNGFGEAVDAVNRFIGEFDPAAGGEEQAKERMRAYLQARKFLHLVTGTLIAARNGQRASADDLLGQIIGADHIASTDDLRDQVLTLIMAGHETTAKTLTWALHLLDQHPDVADQLAEEVQRVVGDGVPDASHFPDLQLCRNVISESMRLYPPVWLMSRRSVADDELGGYTIPAGTLVSISQWVLHHDPRFHEEPYAFRPSRFGPDAPDMHPFSYLPFGGGSRVCIGQHLAIFEATLVLAMLSRFRFSVTPDCVVEPEALVTMRPRNGLSTKVTRR
ncbi:hypothetical protein VV02_06570 [Luteipulveratus mongoliensis]|uniref:Cytochrome P450 n=2 Tax=Luteipulveratus mongoliensis TaxID=571913 RepID=A0A0K1JFV0_9MICO|nr:hypothetical protein VV02_06570 [Luteipulveratus mongoliensis]